MAPSIDSASIEHLNQNCFCVTLDRQALEAAFTREAGFPSFFELLREERQHLFSNVSVFVSEDSFAQMHRTVQLIEAIAATPAYCETVGTWGPPISRNDYGPAGAFMGYDFHVGVDGPKLIEINTNAGGALLNAVLARAQRTCCGTDAKERPGFPDAAFEPAVVRMFQEEWRRQRGSGKPERIAIVDDDPTGQYLYPEFLLIQALLRRHDIEAVIADPMQLTYKKNKLVHSSGPIDLVYNRLVDFPLAHPGHAALRDGYASGDVVLTPNPNVHARLADKRNLTLLSDPQRLATWGVTPSDVELLAAAVPETIVVNQENANELWAARRRLFFKPAAGYGSKAAYRGSKLTRSVWAEIVGGGYVAQAYVAPSERMVEIDGAVEPRKMDVRLYTYQGEVLLTAARLYRGQTTNFRTEGGGFAPVLRTPTRR